MPCFTTTARCWSPQRCTARARRISRRAASSALRPAVAIEIGQQAVVGLAVQMDRAAERRLRQHALHLCTGPVLPPVAQEFQLPLAQQLQARQVDRLRIVRSSLMWSGRGPICGICPRAGLELAIFENGEVDAADAQPREIHGDALLDRRGIDRIGQVPRLRRCTMFTYPPGRSSRRRRCRLRRAVAVLRPTGSRVRRHDRRECRSSADRGSRRGTAGRTRSNRPCARCADRSGRPRRTAGPDPGGERCRISGRGPVVRDELHDMLATTISIFVTGSRRMVPRTWPSRRAARDRRVSGVVPTLDAEMRAPAGILDRRTGGLLPGAVALNLQPRLARFVGQQRIELRGQFEHARVVRIQREGDDLIARHIQIDDLRHFACGRRPPLSARLRIELGEVLPERSAFARLRRGRCLPASTKRRGREVGGTDSANCCDSGHSFQERSPIDRVHDVRSENE